MDGNNIKTIINLTLSSKFISSNSKAGKRSLAFATGYKELRSNGKEDEFFKYQRSYFRKLTNKLLGAIKSKGFSNGDAINIIVDDLIRQKICIPLLASCAKDNNNWKDLSVELPVLDAWRALEYERKQNGQNFDFQFAFVCALTRISESVLEDKDVALKRWCSRVAEVSEELARPGGLLIDARPSEKSIMFSKLMNIAEDLSPTLSSGIQKLTENDLDASTLGALYTHFSNKEIIKQIVDEVTNAQDNIGANSFLQNRSGDIADLVSALVPAVDREIAYNLLKDVDVEQFSKPDVLIQFLERFGISGGEVREFSNTVVSKGGPIGKKALLVGLTYAESSNNDELKDFATNMTQEEVDEVYNLIIEKMDEMRGFSPLTPRS